MKPLIRNYSSEDLDLVISLLRLSTPDYFHPSEESDLVEYLSSEIEDYYVLEVKSLILGCGGINYSKRENKAIISWDIIHPDFRSQGLGRLLLTHRLGIIREKHISKVVVRSSQKAYKFYENANFKLTRTQEDFWAPGFDLFEMELLF
ncbi:MAG: GNAT family N-acetyltransferase [Bacteroidota bacterium]